MLSVKFEILFFMFQPPLVDCLLALLCVWSPILDDVRESGVFDLMLVERHTCNVLLSLCSYVVFLIYLWNRESTIYRKSGKKNDSRFHKYFGIQFQISYEGIVSQLFIGNRGKKMTHVSTKILEFGKKQSTIT